MERWRTIPDTDGHYQVSDTGRVRSVRSGRLLQPWMTCGYQQVGLGRSRRAYVHRLVALCFVPGAADGMQVDHIDCDRTNNHAGNLRWVTQLENLRFQAADSGVFVPTPEVIARMVELRRSGLSLTAIGRALGCHRGTVRKYLKEAA